MMPNTGLIIISLDDLNALLDVKFLQLQQALNVIGQNGEPGIKDELLTRKEAKGLLKISYPTLHNWTKKKVIQSRKIQRRVYYSRSELANFLSCEKGKQSRD